MASVSEKVDIAHSEEQDHFASLGNVDSGSKNDLLAQQASEDEHNLTLIQALRRHPKAVMWSILVSTSIIMEGYDVVLIGSFMAQEEFSRRVG